MIKFWRNYEYYCYDNTNAYEFCQGFFIDGAKGEQYISKDNFFTKPEIKVTQFDGKLVSVDIPKSETKSTLTGYQVYRDGLTFGGILPISQLTYTDADVCGNYDYFVTAIYISEAGESDASNTVQIGNGTVISTQPVDVNAVVGEDVSFNVTATGDNLTYQWRYNSSDISGAENNIYSMTNVQIPDAGNYTVIVSGNCGDVTPENSPLRQEEDQSDA